jgi:hypothetical protein
MESGREEGVGGLAAEGISWQGLRTKAGSTNATNVDKTFAEMMKSHLFLMQAQGEIQRVGVTVLQAAGHHALKHSADLLLHSFDADSHVHVGNCHNSCRVKNCGGRGSDEMVTAGVQGSCSGTASLHDFFERISMANAAHCTAAAAASSLSRRPDFAMAFAELRCNY